MCCWWLLLLFVVVVVVWLSLSVVSQPFVVCDLVIGWLEFEIAGWISGSTKRCFIFFTILNWLGQQFSLEVIPKILKLSRTSTGIRNQHSFSCSNIKIISLYQTSGTYHHNLIHGQNSGPEFMNRIHGTILTITDRFRRQTGGRNSLKQVR